MLICPLREKCHDKRGCYHKIPHKAEKSCGKPAYCGTIGQYIDCIEFHELKHSDVFDVISIDE